MGITIPVIAEKFPVNCLREIAGKHLKLCVYIAVSLAENAEKSSKSLLISLLAGKPNQKIAKRRRPRPYRGYPQTETGSASMNVGKGPGIPGFLGNCLARRQRPRLVGGAGSLERTRLCSISLLNRENTGNMSQFG
jgi:hypothetical protein